MKQKKLRFLGIGLAAAGCLAGCGETKTVWQPVQDNTIRIAVVGDESYINADGTMEGAALACSDFYEKNGISMEVVVYNDNTEYSQAISRAGEIAADDSIAAVLIMEELDYIDSVGEIYEEAEKPFIILSGCNESTIEKGFSYMLVDCINAKVAGSVMAQYVTEQGYSYVAFCHSDTNYEVDELKGFQSALSDSEVHLADAFVGPYTQEEFDIAYDRWVSLGIEAVCVSNYDTQNSDVVRMLREKGSDIAVVSDYVMDTEEDIEANGAYLDGTAIVSLYVNDEEENDADITGRYYEANQKEMSEKARQGYDILYILGEALTSGADSSLEAVNYIKQSDGFDGVSGTVAFDEKGSLIPNGNEILIFKDGYFQ